MHHLTVFKKQQLNYENKLRISDYIKILYILSYVKKKYSSLIVGLNFHNNTAVAA